jgi:hypothetical protein
VRPNFTCSALEINDAGSNAPLLLLLLAAREEEEEEEEEEEREDEEDDDDDDEFAVTLPPTEPNMKEPVLDPVDVATALLLALRRFDLTRYGLVGAALELLDAMTATADGGNRVSEEGNAEEEEDGEEEACCWLCMALASASNMIAMAAQSRCFAFTLSRDNKK